jgi:GNAT superfamily N-acetyltransferase
MQQRRLVEQLREPDSRARLAGLPGQWELSPGDVTRMAPFQLRLARSVDRPNIERLIERSARALCAVDYPSELIDAALGSAWGVDSQLIIDQTYFVVELDAELIAAGGWSFRRTLFGADARPDRSPDALDPALEAAKIRAFFVAPEFARRGIGRALLAHCEREAAARGFAACELAATLTGERLYRAMGYAPLRRFAHPLPGGLQIEFVAMHKALD